VISVLITDYIPTLMQRLALDMETGDEEMVTSPGPLCQDEIRPLPAAVSLRSRYFSGKSRGVDSYLIKCRLFDIFSQNGMLSVELYPIIMIYQKSFMYKIVHHQIVKTVTAQLRRSGKVWRRLLE
jgi:hypothetical protein